MTRHPVAVVGGGAAGLAAAEALVGAGHEVVLLERRRRLGGKVSDHHDPLSGWRVENGRHVWMPVCTEFEALLRRTGTESLTRTQPRLRVTYLEAGRPSAVLEVGRLPGALGLLGALGRLSALDGGEKRQLVRGLLALRREGGRLQRSGADQLFTDWLDRQGQSDRVRAVFWRPIVLSILNTPLKEARADLAALAVHEPFLSGRVRGNLAWTVVPHGRLWERMVEHLTGRGATIRTGTAVRSLRVENGGAGPRVTGVVLATGEQQPVSGVVLAVPPGAVRGLLPPGWRDRDPFARGQGLDWSPILNVHLWFDRRVTGEEVLFLVGAPMHFVFTLPSQRPEGGTDPLPSTAQHLDLVVSASDDFRGRSHEEIVGIALQTLHALLPKSRAAVLLASRVVHEHRATWRAVPGSEAHRPGPSTPVAGLTLAGAWTATGWPATIEGAVRSGRAAADALGVQPG